MLASVLRSATRGLCSASQAWRLRPGWTAESLYELCQKQPDYGVGTRVYRVSWESYGYDPADHHVLITGVKKIHQVRRARRRRAARAAHAHRARLHPQGAIERGVWKGDARVYGRKCWKGKLSDAKKDLSGTAFKREWVVLDGPSAR